MISMNNMSLIQLELHRGNKDSCKYGTFSSIISSFHAIIFIIVSKISLSIIIFLQMARSWQNIYFSVRLSLLVQVNAALNTP